MEIERSSRWFLALRWASMGEEEDYELAGELFMGWISYMSMELAGAKLKATSGRFS